MPQQVICDQDQVEVATHLVSTFDGQLPKAMCAQHMVAWCMGFLDSMFTEPEERAIVARYFLPEEPAEPQEERPRRGRKRAAAAAEPAGDPEPATEGLAEPPAPADDSRDPGSQLG